MILPIVTIPAALLRQQTKPLTKQELARKETQQLIDDMLETMPASHGIGLAAPQVNHSVRLTVNARIMQTSKDMENDEEGCLSIPGVYGTILRHARIRVTFLDRKGKKITLRAQGLLARVFQHEIDHLDGILFVDRTK